MENQNVNSVPQVDADAEALDSLFNKYKTRDEKKKRMSGEEMLKKYFNPRQDTEIFRALPKRENEEVIEEAYFHKVQAGKYAKEHATLYCLAKNNPKVQAKDKEGNLVSDQNGNPVMVFQDCPLCAKANAIRKKYMDKSIAGKKKDQLKTKEELDAFEKNKEVLKRAGAFESKLYYIIRGVDRGAEKDGVKFWRFKHNFKGQGVHDKLWKPIILNFYKETGKAYYSAEHGIDLLISVVDNEFNGTTFKDVSAINTKRNTTPLHTDPIIAKQWLDDKITWRDVFKPKKAPGITELQFLQLAAEEREANQKFDMRNTPYYLKDEKKWVIPNHPDLEEAANTKTRNLDADQANDDYDLDDEGGFVGAASSVVNQTNNTQDITQMSNEAPTSTKPSNMGSVDAGANTASAGAYDDLPF